MNSVLLQQHTPLSLSLCTSHAAEIHSLLPWCRWPLTLAEQEKPLVPRPEARFPWRWWPFHRWTWHRRRRSPRPKQTWHAHQTALFKLAGILERPCVSYFSPLTCAQVFSECPFLSPPGSERRWAPRCWRGTRISPWRCSLSPASCTRAPGTPARTRPPASRSVQQLEARSTQQWLPCLSPWWPWLQLPQHLPQLTAAESSAQSAGLR